MERVKKAMSQKPATEWMKRKIAKIKPGTKVTFVTIEEHLKKFRGKERREEIERLKAMDRTLSEMEEKEKASR